MTGQLQVPNASLSGDGYDRLASPSRKSSISEPNVGVPASANLYRARTTGRVIRMMCVMSIGVAALALLKQRLTLKVRVRRDGVWTEMPAAPLVPDDIVQLSLGSVVPADLHLLQPQKWRKPSA